MAQQQKTIIRTPAGRAIFPRLSTPDTKFNAAGEYTIKVAFVRGAQGVDAFLEQLDELHAQAQKDGLAQAREKNPKATKIKEGSLPYTDNPEDENEVLVGFKMTASGTSKKNGKPWSRKPALYDAKGNVLPDNVNVGGGSVVKVAFEPSLYFKPATGAGVSRRLEAVQVLELKEWGGNRSASSFGFEKEEGFTAEQGHFSEPADESDTEGSASAPAANDDF